MVFLNNKHRKCTGQTLNFKTCSFFVKKEVSALSKAMCSLLFFDYKSKYIMSQKLSVVHTRTVKLLTDKIRKEKKTKEQAISPMQMLNP